MNVLDYWEQSLHTFEEINDQLGVSNLLSNIGAVYFSQGDDPKALEYYLESLKVSEQLGNKLRIATALINIGSVYLNKTSTYDKAEEYFLKALPISEESEDLNAIGTASVNLGEIYLNRNDSENALFYFQKAKDAMEKSHGNVPYALLNMGKAQLQKGNPERAIQLQSEAYQRAQKIDAKLEMAQSLLSLAETYEATKNYLLALQNYSKAQKIAKEIDSNKELEQIYEGMANVYAQIQNFEEAYRYKDLLGSVKDTLYNLENARKIGLLQFQFDLEKKEAEIQLLNKDNDIQAAEIQRASYLRNFLFAVAGLLLIIIGGVTYQYRYAQRSNKIITEERNRSEEILLNILPEETAEELKRNGFVKAKKFDNATVLFTDFREFTKVAEMTSPELLVKSIDFYFKKFDEIVSRYGLEKIKTIGDSYMCAGGVPTPSETNPKDAVLAAFEMVNFVEQVKVNPPEGVTPFEVRVGISSGPVVAGVVGTKKISIRYLGNDSQCCIKNGIKI